MGRKPKVKSARPAQPGGACGDEEAGRPSSRAAAPAADVLSGSPSGPAPSTETTSVTAAVTADPWAHLDIPEQFQRNPDNTWKHPCLVTKAPELSSPASDPASSTPLIPKPVTVPGASGSAGSLSGTETKPGPAADLYAHLRVDQQEIENNIRREADRRFHQWTAKNGEAKRPTKRAILKQVRKEFFP